MCLGKEAPVIFLCNISNCLDLYFSLQTAVQRLQRLIIEKPLLEIGHLFSFLVRVALSFTKTNIMKAAEEWFQRE